MSTDETIHFEHLSERSELRRNLEAMAPCPVELIPSILEIGPGRGDFLLHLAQENPLRRIAAIEYKRKRYEKLVKRAEPYPNLLLHLGDARQVLPEFKPASLEAIYILFSDPWPKRRHAKHRLFQSEFVATLGERLKPGGQLFIATDDPTYREAIRDLLAQSPFFIEVPGAGLTFPTFYAQKWAQEGRSLFAFTYRRK